MQHELPHGVAAFFDGVAKAAAFSLSLLRPEPKFSCGDCDRNASCGLPPDDLCVIKAMQMARDGDWRPRRPIVY